MTTDECSAEDVDSGTASTRRAVDDIIRRSGARAVASIEDLDRFQAHLWDSDDELEAFLVAVRASRDSNR